MAQAERGARALIALLIFLEAVGQAAMRALEVTGVALEHRLLMALGAAVVEAVTLPLPITALEVLVS